MRTKKHECPVCGGLSDKEVNPGQFSIHGKADFDGHDGYEAIRVYMCEFCGILFGEDRFSKEDK